MKLYIKDINDYNNDFYKEYYEKLNKYQKKKINTLKNERDKKLSLLGLIIISKYLNQNINLIKYKNRKPYILENPIYFSISHKYPYVVVVFDTQNIGIDLEIIRDIDKRTIKYLKSNDNLEALINWTIYESKIKNSFGKLLKTFILNKEIVVTINYERKAN